MVFDWKFDFQNLRSKLQPVPLNKLFRNYKKNEFPVDEA